MGYVCHFAVPRPCPNITDTPNEGQRSVKSDLSFGWFPDLCEAQSGLTNPNTLPSTEVQLLTKATVEDRVGEANLTGKQALCCPKPFIEDWPSLFTLKTLLKFAQFGAKILTHKHQTNKTPRGGWFFPASLKPRQVHHQSDGELCQAADDTLAFVIPRFKAPVVRWVVGGL